MLTVMNLRQNTLYKGYMFEVEMEVTDYKYVNAYNAKASDSTERLFRALHCFIRLRKISR